MGAGASQDSGKNQQSSNQQAQRAPDSQNEGAAASPPKEQPSAASQPTQQQQPQQQQQQPQQQQQQQQATMNNDEPHVHGTQRDGAAAQNPTAAAKVQAVSAFNNPPPKRHAPPPEHNTGGKTQEELDEEEWEREKERLNQRLREKREREQQQQQQQQQQAGAGAPTANSPNKPPAGDPNRQVAPPTTGAPGAADGGAKKKKLLNGTNIEYRYPSGSVYVGGFKDGKLHGFGKYRYHPSGDRYEGEWIADMKHGQGMYQYDCGDKYTGEWRTGKKHGKGTYAFQSGDEYVGSWKEDKIHGHGIFHIARNGNKYEGAWVESYRHGYGVLTCGNNDVYMGNWTKGKEDGLGVLTYANGNIYAGEWKAGQMDGKGILVEDGLKYTVEHVSGYLVSRVNVEHDATVVPEYNAANKLYLQHIQKMEAERLKGADGGGGGGGGGDPEALTKLKIERDMWEKKYNDLLAQKGGDAVDDDDELDYNDHGAVRTFIMNLKEQREMQARRADEAEQKARQSESQITELNFENRRLADEAAAAAANGGGGHGASQAEFDKMQRRVADLERELNARKQASGNSNSRASNDPLELKAQLELLEGEVRHLRSTREELQKQREANLDAQRSVMNLEQKNEELLKEINVIRQRASHTNNEANEEAQRQLALHVEEIKELRAELQDQKVAALTNEQKLAKAKNKLREAEEKALRVTDLEAQLAAVKNTKANNNAAIDKRSDELDSLRAKNAELMRQLEEMEGQPSAGATHAAAGAAAANAAAQREIADLNAKLEAQHNDYKKEKKKHKKAAAERDELSAKVAAFAAEAERAKRSSAIAAGAVAAVVRVRPPVGDEPPRSVIEVSPPNTVSVQGNSFTGFAACVGVDQNNNIEASIEDLRPVARGVAQGYNGCVLTLGPMGGGKSHFTAAAAKALLADAFKSVEESLRPGGRAQSYNATISATCVEVNCDGIFDLNNPGSTGSDLRPMRDAFGAVVVDGVVSVPSTTGRDAAVDYIAAVGRRRRQRSHLIYSLHVQYRHKVTDAVLRAKFSIADLSGSGALGEQADVEAARYVNKSIMAVANVVNALAAAGNTGVPYRDDPLTMILADALGGNCRLGVVCAVGPSEETAEAAVQAISLTQKLTTVECRPVPQFESADYARLRQLVSQLQSPEAAEPVLAEIDSLRE